MLLLFIYFVICNSLCSVADDGSFLPSYLNCRFSYGASAVPVPVTRGKKKTKNGCTASGSAFLRAPHDRRDPSVSVSVDSVYPDC